jgi:hypothetical protein
MLHTCEMKGYDHIAIAVQPITCKDMTEILELPETDCAQASAMPKSVLRANVFENYHGHYGPVAYTTSITMGFGSVNLSCQFHRKRRSTKHV